MSSRKTTPRSTIKSSVQSKVTCCLCKKEKNSFEVRTSFKSLSGQARTLARAKQNNVNDDDLLCNACRTKYGKKSKDADYTPKKDKKKKRLNCFIPNCQQISVHDSIVKDETEKQLFLSHFNTDSIENVPLCKKHYNDFSNFRNWEKCTVCETKFQYRDGKSIKKYSIQNYHVESSNASLQEEEEIETVVSVGDVICNTCYRKLSGSTMWRLEKLDEEIDIPIPSPSNIHERAAKKCAKHLISKFKEDRSLLLADLYDHYIEIVEEDCTTHSIEDDERFRKTSKWLLMYLKTLISAKVLGVHKFKHMASSGVKKKLSSLLYCKLSDLVEMLHLATYDARIRDVQEKEELKSDDSTILQHESNEIYHADILASLLNINKHAQENVEMVNSKYNSDDIISTMTSISFNSLYNEISPWLWNAVMMLTASKTDIKNGEMVTDFSTKDTILFGKGESAKLSQKKMRRLILCYMILLNIDQECTYPIPVLVTDLIRSYSGSTELIKYMNRLGFCASVDSHERYMNAVITLQSKVTPIDKLISQNPLIITVDNLDWMIRHAMIHAGGRLSHHVTTVQGVQTKIDQEQTESDMERKESLFIKVSIYGCGRCFFRCIAYYAEPIIRRAERHMYGMAVLDAIATHEQSLADKVRNAVVDAIEYNKEQLEDIITATPYILESRDGHFYASLDERIQDMRRTSAYACSLELYVCSYLAKTQIHLYTEDAAEYKLLAKIPQGFYKDSQPISLLYYPDTAEKPGHYDLLLMQGQQVNALLDVRTDNNLLFSSWAAQCDDPQMMNASLIQILDPELGGVLDGLTQNYSICQPIGRRARGRLRFSDDIAKTVNQAEHRPPPLSLGLRSELQEHQELRSSDFISLSSEEEQAFTAFGLELFDYIIEREICDKQNELNVTLPGLKAKLMMERNPSCLKSHIMYLNVFNKPASNIETVRNVIDYLAAQYVVGQKLKHIVICGDGQVFDFINRIKSEQEDSMMWLIPMLGDFHLLFNTMPIIMKVYWKGGLLDLKTHGGAALTGLGKCQHFRRTHMFLVQTWEAIYRTFMKMFLDVRSPNECSTEEVLQMVQQCLLHLKGKLNQDLAKVYDSDFIHAQKEMNAQISGLEEEFSMFCQKMGEKSKTVLYWVNFLEDMKGYVGLYIANRLGIWNLRMASLKLLLPLFHAFDRPNYSRMLPLHSYHMNTLPSYVLDHFKNGGFCVSESGLEGNQLMLDEYHEMLINKDTKNVARSLTPGRTMKFESVCRFLPYRASVLSNFKNEICRGQTDEDQQKGYYKSVIDKELGNINLYIKKFSQAEIWEVETLKPLFEAAPADGHEAAREHDMLNYKEIGKVTAEHYIKSHILEDPSVKPPQRQKKLRTFQKLAETKKILKRSLKHQKDQLQLYKTELIMSQHGEQVDNDLLGQVWEAPLSLSEPDSDMPFKGTKSAVKVFYQTRYTSPPALPTFYPHHWKPDVVILEGMNMIYTQPNQMEHHTFEQYVHHLLQFYTNKHLLEHRVKEVHIIFDDPDGSIVTPKLMERSRRDAKGKVTVVAEESVEEDIGHIEDSTPLPANWKKFMSLRKNRRQMVIYLSKAFLEHGKKYLQNFQTFYVSGIGKDAYSVTATGDICPAVKYTGLHIETDTRIFLHIQNIAERNILIYSKDIDIPHIGLGFKLSDTEILVQSSMAKSDQQWLQLSQLQRAIESDPDMFSVPKDLRSVVIRNLYVFSGCDYVSFFHGHGKQAFFKCLYKYCSFITGHTNPAKNVDEYGSLAFTCEEKQKLGLLSFYRLVGSVYFEDNSIAFLSQDISTPEQLFNNCKGASMVEIHEEFLNRVRQSVFTTKLMERDHLAPTDALQLHWKRCTWVCQMWDTSAQNDIVCSPLDNYGYKVTKVGEQHAVFPVWHSDEGLQVIQRRRGYLTGCRCGTSKGVRDKPGPFCKDKRCVCVKGKKGGSRSCIPGVCKCRHCSNAIGTLGKSNKQQNTVQSEENEPPSKKARLDPVLQEPASITAAQSIDVREASDEEMCEEDDLASSPSEVHFHLCSKYLL